MQSHVVIVQRRLTRYRTALFDDMRERLAGADIGLRLLHGDPHEQEIARNDHGSLAWAEPIPTRYGLGGRLCWQPFGRVAQGADLVIVTQENKLLYNLVALSLRRPRRLAFWGHGRNFQAARPDGARERFKHATTTWVDWWFTYTSGTARLLRSRGFPEDRITVVDNATDTGALMGELDSVSEQEIRDYRGAAALTGGRTALYIGSLYGAKRIGFLIEAGRSIARTVPGFVLVVMGDGSERHGLERLKTDERWLRYVGYQAGHQRALVMRCCDVCLNPGLVGLSILDAGAAGLPMITTEASVDRSAEIDYMTPGQDGLVTGDAIAAFAAEVTALLEDPGRLAGLSLAARRLAARYTIENMSARFCGGIRHCLGRPPRRSES